MIVTLTIAASLLCGAATGGTTSAAPALAGEPGSVERTQALVDAFAVRFGMIGPRLAANLDQLYTADVRFRDPITEVNGLPALQRYLEHFGEQANGARFVITDTLVQPGNAAVFWTMVMPAKDGEAGAGIEGVSHLRVRDLVYEERDYFDLGEVYDQVPVVNWFTGLVKSRLAP